VPSAEGEAVAAVGALVLGDSARCAASRFDITLASACSKASSPYLLDAAPIGKFRPTITSLDLAYSVRLPDGGMGMRQGGVELEIRRAGEYIVYLGTPNVPFRLTRAGTEVEPVCSRYLPLAPTPEGYGAPCDSQLLGAYALNLEAGAYRLELDPVASRSVRVVIERRRVPGVTLASSRPSCDLSGTQLSEVCAFAGSSTAVNGEPFGTEPLSSIALSSSFGVHLTAGGPTNEGAVSFTPPYTADYTVYVGTPNVGVEALDDVRRPRYAECSASINDARALELTGAVCPALRGAFTFHRLQGGVPHTLELGPIAPQSWVRTIVAPATADSDSDGLGDAYDLCPSETAVTSCGCETCPEIELELAVGGQHTCALKAGAVRCWGFGYLGRLGYGNTDNIGDDEVPSSSVADVDVGGRVVQISAGTSHTCALLDTGAVRCWGMGYFGQPGYGNTNDLGDDETPASAGDVNVGGRVVQISAGGVHTCALLDTGAVRCWGMGHYGHLGYGNINNIGDDELPASAGDVNVGGRVVQISAGAEHTCALLDTGAVRCWGRGSEGQLGYGNPRSIGDDEMPASAGDVNVGGRVVQVTAASRHTCALLETGAVRCWGLSSDGRLGYGNINRIGDNETPASAGDVNVGGSVVQLSAADTHTCALLDTGAVRCWGSGWQLGYGSSNNIGDNEMPASAGDVNVGGRVVQVAAGSEHTCALLDTEMIRCWGYGAHGELGYGNTRFIGDDEAPASAGNVDVF